MYRSGHELIAQNPNEQKNQTPAGNQDMPNYTEKNYLDVSVYTQDAENCQWGIFDFENVKIDQVTGKVIDEFADEKAERSPNYETCKFQLKGSNFITR